LSVDNCLIVSRLSAKKIACHYTVDGGDKMHKSSGIKMHDKGGEQPLFRSFGISRAKKWQSSSLTTCWRYIIKASKLLYTEYPIKNVTWWSTLFIIAD
jgi:hypothetical protein